MTAHQQSRRELPAFAQGHGVIKSLCKRGAGHSSVRRSKTSGEISLWETAPGVRWGRAGDGRRSATKAVWQLVLASSKTKIYKKIRASLRCDVTNCMQSARLYFPTHARPLQVSCTLRGTSASSSIFFGFP